MTRASTTSARLPQWPNFHASTCPRHTTSPRHQRVDRKTSHSPWSRSKTTHFPQRIR